MSDLGVDVETTGGYRVPLDNWNDLANYLAMQRVRLTVPFSEKLTLLRSMEPEYRAWRDGREGDRRQWMVETTDTHPPTPVRTPR